MENLALDFEKWLFANNQADPAHVPEDYEFDVPAGVWVFEDWIKEHNMQDSSSRVSLKPDKKDASWVSPLAGAPVVSSIPTSGLLLAC